MEVFLLTGTNLTFGMQVVRQTSKILSINASRDSFLWHKIFRQLLPASLLEQVEFHGRDYVMVQEWLTQFQLIVDSFEQARVRPSDNEVH
jgi:hypothetical protein